MSSLCKSFHVQQFFLIVTKLLIFFVGFWPIPGLSHPAGEFYYKAVEAIQDKNLQQAESLLQQAITDFPAYAEAHYLLGMVQYQMTQDAGEAIPSLEQAVQLNGNFATAHYHLGLLLLKQDKMEEAQQHFQQALAIYPGYWEARLTLAKTFDQTGAIDNAIQEYESVLKQEPLATDALFHLSYHLMQENQTDRAQDLLMRLTTHDSQHAKGWYLLGRLHEQGQQFDQAMEAYHRVLENDPEHSEAHYNLGFLYQGQDQPQKAIHHFQRVTQLNPTDAEAYFNLGVLLVGQKQLDQAGEAYQKGIALQPDSVEGQFNIGAFYEFHKEDLEQAQKHYEKYIDLGGEDLRIKQLFHE